MITATAAIPTLSVALCTYNGAEYLQAQLDSIANQTRLPDELVICDDGSTDDTLALAHAFQQQAAFPVHVHQNSINLGSTRNFEQAIQRCQGEIITLADQDDVWMPEKLAVLAEAFQTDSEVGMVFSDALVVDQNLSSLGAGLWERLRFSPRQQRALRDGRAIEVLLKHRVVTGATMAFRARFRESLFPISPHWIHDGWIAFIISTQARLLPIPTPLIQYRQHAHNQVGIIGASWRQKLATAYVEKQAFYQKEVARYQALLDHLIQLEARPIKASLQVALHQKIDHLAKLTTLSRSLPRRLPIIIQEVLAGRYQKFSGGMLSIFKDLLLSE